MAHLVEAVAGLRILTVPFLSVCELNFFPISNPHSYPPSPHQDTVAGPGAEQQRHGGGGDLERGDWDAGEMGATWQDGARHRRHPRHRVRHLSNLRSIKAPTMIVRVLA